MMTPKLLAFVFTSIGVLANVNVSKSVGYMLVETRREM